MRKTIISIGILILLVAIFSDVILRERVVAVVGDRPILLTEVEMALLLETGGNIPDDSLQYREMVIEKIEQLVNERLLLEAAIMDSIFITPDFLDQHFRQRWEQFTQGFASEAALEAALREEGFTIEHFQKEMRDNLHEMMIKQQFVQERFGNVEVTPDYVSDFYNNYIDSIPERPTTVRLSAIVLEQGLDEDFVAENMGIAKQIRKEIDATTDFHEIGDILQEKYPDITIQSGRLGTFRRGDLHSTLDSTAFAIRVGAISKPVRSPNGIHIIKKVDGNPAQVTLEHITIPITRTITAETFNQYVEDIYSRLVEHPDSFEAFVEMYSVDRKSKGQEGDIGLFELDDLDPNLRTNVIHAVEGEILPPVMRTRQADIFKLTEYEPARKITPEQDYDFLRELAIQHRTKELLMDYLDSIRDEVYIDIRY